MTRFSNAIIVGASGGIGGALADALEERGAQVRRLSRRSDPPVDLADEETIATAARTLEGGGPYDLVMVAAGLLHDEEIAPEKSWKMLEAAPLAKLFAVNASGPLLVARHFLPLMPRNAPAAFAALSARVGSIGDNRLGGWYGYRASKAALNQLLRTLAIDLARTHEQMVVAALHPGTVDTALSKPFQRGVPDAQLFTPQKSAAHLLDVIEGLAPADSGHHFDWAGKRVDP
ncbi:SDR family NAD(P)-dependent oxidoreductase [Sphingomicrobium nitratireducens]|uniref:SDR family NAD(P)-dependent oxidoreductase n=1 Tax=Sphingomicrobium nitratireducens TaxID=2964666 RepID=UPI00223FE422|nr:SDR family NAD(P)-dependent oxidoreductase [Sphingomicrobium nitratireducens]